MSTHARMSSCSSALDSTHMPVNLSVLLLVALSPAGKEEKCPYCVDGRKLSVGAHA